MKIVLTFFQTGSSSFLARINGVYSYAARHGWHIENVPPDERAEGIGKLLEFWRPIGCIVEGGSSTEMRRSDFGAMPVVYINHRRIPTDNDASCVRMDDMAIGQMAAHELIRGKFVHYGYVGIESRSFWDPERRKAFSSQIENAGLPFSYLPIDRTSSATCTRMQIVATIREYLKKIPRPAGIFCANDTAAAMVSAAAVLEGIKVPREISILGVDDEETICRNCMPELSSIRPDFARGGYLAAELLDRAIRHPQSQGKEILYPPEGITRRGSINIARHKDSAVEEALLLIRQKACLGLSSADVHKVFACSGRLADIRFKTATGQTILNAIREVRLSKAKELIIHGCTDFDLLAQQSGYATPNAFRRFFKQMTGLTVSTWRRKHRSR